MKFEVFVLIMLATFGNLFCFARRQSELLWLSRESYIFPNSLTPNEEIGNKLG